jgi:hypothetical protein
LSRVHGKDISTLTLDNQPLLSDTLSINPMLSAATHDVTTLGDDWIEHIAGLKGGDEISHEMMYDNTTTTGTWDFVSSRVGGVPVALVIGDGTRTLTYSVIVKSVSLPISVADMMKFTASYQVTGAVSFT